MEDVVRGIMGNGVEAGVAATATVSEKTFLPGHRSGLCYREKWGKTRCSAGLRFGDGRSPAMVYVGILFLGSKHSQYTLGTLYSPLANPQYYGSAKRIGLTDSARRALDPLDYPCSKGGDVRGRAHSSAAGVGEHWDRPYV